MGDDLAGDVMEPVIWTLDTYVVGLRFDQDLTLLEIMLGFGGTRLKLKSSLPFQVFLLSGINSELTPERS